MASEQFVSVLAGIVAESSLWRRSGVALAPVENERDLAVECGRVASSPSQRQRNPSERHESLQEGSFPWELPLLRRGLLTFTLVLAEEVVAVTRRCEHAERLVAEGPSYGDSTNAGLSPPSDFGIQFWGAASITRKKRSVLVRLRSARLCLLRLLALLPEAVLSTFMLEIRCPEKVDVEGWESVSGSSSSRRSVSDLPSRGGKGDSGGLPMRRAASSSLLAVPFPTARLFPRRSSTSAFASSRRTTAAAEAERAASRSSRLAAQESSAPRVERRVFARQVDSLRLGVADFLRGPSARSRPAVFSPQRDLSPGVSPPPKPVERSVSSSSLANMFLLARDRCTEGRPSKVDGYRVLLSRSPSDADKSEAESLRSAHAPHCVLPAAFSTRVLTLYSDRRAFFRIWIEGIAAARAASAAVVEAAMLERHLFSRGSQEAASRRSGGIPFHRIDRTGGSRQEVGAGSLRCAASALHRLCRKWLEDILAMVSRVAGGRRGFLPTGGKAEAAGGRPWFSGDRALRVPFWAVFCATATAVCGAFKSGFFSTEMVCRSSEANKTFSLLLALCEALTSENKPRSFCSAAFQEVASPDTPLYNQMVPPFMLAICELRDAALVALSEMAVAIHASLRLEPSLALCKGGLMRARLRELASSPRCERLRMLFWGLARAAAQLCSDAGTDSHRGTPVLLMPEDKTLDSLIASNAAAGATASTCCGMTLWWSCSVAARFVFSLSLRKQSAAAGAEPPPSAEEAAELWGDALVAARVLFSQLQTRLAAARAADAAKDDSERDAACSRLALTSGAEAALSCLFAADCEALHFAGGALGGAGGFSVPTELKGALLGRALLLSRTASGLYFLGEPSDASVFERISLEVRKRKRFPRGRRALLLGSQLALLFNASADSRRRLLGVVSPSAGATHAASSAPRRSRLSSREKWQRRAQGQQWPESGGGRRSAACCTPPSLLGGHGSGASSGFVLASPGRRVRLVALEEGRWFSLCAAKPAAEGQRPLSASRA